MGLFDIIKKGKEQVKQIIRPRKEIYWRTTENLEEDILAFNIEKINSVRHRNNKVMDLMLARMTKQNPEHTLYMDSSDYVTFEIPQGMEITEEIMQAVMQQYDIDKQINAEEKQYYLGQLINDGNELIFGNKSVAVENMTKQLVQQRETQRAENREKTWEERQERENQARKEFLDDLNSRGYLNEVAEEKKNRKQSPTLTRVYRPIYEKEGNKKYSNYDGVNVNTGDILRIRKVDKVGKDGSGTYLYSAYIYNTPNDHDCEYLSDTPMGVAVCFELQKRLEDIAKDGDINEVRKVLELLSDSRNFENPEQLSYIGEIDKDGMINRREMSLSSAIRNVITKMQREFTEGLGGEGR